MALTHPIPAKYADREITAEAGGYAIRDMANSAVFAVTGAERQNVPSSSKLVSIRVSSQSTVAGIPVAKGARP